MTTTTQDKPTPCRNVQPDPFALKPAKPCRICGDAIQPARANLEKTTCIDCQADLDRQEPPKHTVAIPYSKGAYQYIHNPLDLFNTNPKEPRA